ncbi:Hypothetical protein NTJ_12620 [Nesidiocoris tenuis]|uniref:Uncharacterized protein n=1 Tax=Nesidiocoris tenuis TaxID=355587 RepID=A0ABN7B6B9_9HEMI|nr:Hypothetical protein NTJ_12620 [Nesidiocoris tenuis]
MDPACIWASISILISAKMIWKRLMPVRAKYTEPLVGPDVGQLPSDMNPQGCHLFAVAVLIFDNGTFSSRFQFLGAHLQGLIAHNRPQRSWSPSHFLRDSS